MKIYCTVLKTRTNVKYEFIARGDIEVIANAVLRLLGLSATKQPELIVYWEKAKILELLEDSFILRALTISPEKSPRGAVYLSKKKLGLE